MGSFSSTLLLFFFFFFFTSSLANHHNPITVKGVDIEKPVLDISPPPLSGHSSSQGVKDTLRCERIRVSGISRLKLGSYANSFHITLAPSVSIPERLHNKIQVCFHRNNTLGWCQCQKDEWRSVQKGIWSSVMSPYETRYVDVRINGEILDSVTVALEEDFQKWRLICLALGSLLLLVAPIISSWVPFYYSSSMAIGIFLVIIILLFQGMKLLPTGRKNIFYLTIYGSVLGAGSFILHQFSLIVNSILQSFGLNEEMHNPVAIFVLLGIILGGAALGYWIVRRFVISKEDGSVDAGVAQFVKWAMRIVGTAFILQSTLDPPLAIGALVSCGAVCKLISSIKWLHGWYEASGNDNYSLQWVRGTRGRAEFLSKSTPKGKVRNSPGEKIWNSPKRSAWSDSPVRGVVSPSSGISPQSSGTQIGQDYYSIFHKTSNRKKFTKKEWDEFTRESTKQALTDSRSVTETVNGSHKFVIKGYSLAKGIGVGKHIASETFTVGDYQWAIYFYPDGKNPEDNSAYVSVFIALASEGTDVRALFELTLLDQSGNGKHKVHSHFDRSLESGPYTLKYRGSMWGYKRFFKRAQLEASTFLKDDCLKINCTVGVVVSSIDCSKLNTIQVPDSDIGAHFGMLLENEEGSDVTFSVDGERFHAHKLVLAARSTAFETEFFNGMEEDDHDIVVTDMEPKVFKALLHFIYRDTLIDDEELFMSRSSFLSSVSESFAAKLLAAAEKYGLPRLKLMCESVLCKDISIDSVAYILVLADRYRASELKSICLQFSAENLVAVMQSDGFEYLKENCPLLQSELLKTVAGCEEEFSGEGKCRSVWAQFSDGGDTNDRSVRQQTWENGVERSQSLWVHLSDGVNNNDSSPGKEA
ncbi:uncharacterized protein LOC113860926 isoform X1 [Abrus precatorius]|uniref:Uncharacterized protein LOC113860926 isoform X1 n=1 Tax=Abrus precatorius TaxID=3816 RepID=A0A8B8KZ75_ABRPR|nr:uncharacterized protein LOC113860926 isoform X1 [Abrus precatorius]